MGSAANQAKTRWNAKNYTQVKVNIAPEIASSFKLACQAEAVSMASVLSRFMAEYSKSTAKRKSTTSSEDASTKKKRRQLIDRATQLVVLARDAQECANDNVHENFRDTDNFAEAEESVALMDEAIGILESIY